MMLLNKYITCSLIGEGSLALHCAQYLLDNGHKIQSIITRDPKLQSFAKNHQLPLFSSPENFLKTPNPPFDYLFSLSNLNILPKKLLILARKLAINYHDALLPKYAGIHATSWAIINQEKIHGITWHVMTEQVDTGNILKQKQILIDKNETAFSLNLKCYAAGIESFSELIHQLTSHTFNEQPQDLNQRTYYAYNQKPTGNGWINWNDTAENIERLFRALSLNQPPHHYPNRVGTLKFILNNKVYIIDNIKITKNRSITPAGTIIKLNSNEIGISTKTKNVIIRNLKTINGSLKLIKNFSMEHKLQCGDCLPSPNNKLQQYYQQLSSLLTKSDFFWMQQLKKMQPAPFSFLSLQNQQLTYKSTIFSGLKLSDTLQKKIKKLLPSTSIGNVLLNAFLIYFFRSTSKEVFSVEITYPSLIEETQKINSLIANYIPLNLEFNEKLNFKKTLAKLEKQLQAIKYHRSYLTDIYIRYPELQNNYQPSFIGIIIDDLEQEKSQRQLSHPITLSFNKQNLQIYISKSWINVNSQSILNNITKHLKTLLEDVIR